MKYYSVIVRNELSSHEKTWRRPKWILWCERSQFEKAAYCMTWLSWRGKTIETVQRSLIARDWGEGLKSGTWRILRAVEILCDTIMVNTYYTFVQICKTYNTRVNPEANYGLWVIMCQCKVISCSKRSLLWRMLIRGRLLMGRSSEYMGNLCTFLSMLLWT